MSDRSKVGVRVDSALWERFRENVKERKGQTRGVLGDELENAIREYLRDDSTPTEKRMEKRLARIEKAVGAATPDGGTETLPEPSHTHAPSRISAAVEEKPSANAATEKKVAYLAECVLDAEVPNSRELVTVPREKLIDVVKDEYGFRSDTAKRYVERLVEYFDLREHPRADGILVSPDRYAELTEELREQERENASERMEEL